MIKKCFFTALLVILIFSLGITVFLQENKITDLKDKISDLKDDKTKLEEKILALTNERDNLSSTKTALVEQLKIKNQENSSMKSLLKAIQPNILTIWDLTREGCYCTSINPWLENNRNLFFQFNQEIIKFLPPANPQKK